VETHVAAGALESAEALIKEGRQAAEMLGDERLSALANLQRAWLRSETDSRGWSDRALSEAEQAIRVFERHEDHRALAHAWDVVRGIHWLRGHLGAAREAAESGLYHAERAGDERRQGWHRVWRTAAAYFGPQPFDEVDIEMERDLAWAREGGSLWVEAIIVGAQGMQEAARGNRVAGRELIARGSSGMTDLGMTLLYAANIQNWAWLVTDDPIVAEERLRESFELLSDAGEKANLSTVAANLADALYAQDRYDEAEEMLSAAVALGASDDIFTQVIEHGVRAKIFARRGMTSEAERLARDAVGLAGETEWVDMRGDSFLALGEVLWLADRPEEAAAAMEKAISLWEAKGNVLFAGRTRARLDELKTSSLQ
jgi:tetratricopeptide (TPR) repeat protein